MAFATIDVTKGITGTIPVANGGTGLASGTTGQFLKFTGSTAIGTGEAGGGKVLQVLNMLTATETVVSNNTYTDVGITLAITPSSTSSKILIIAQCNGVGKFTNNTFAKLRMLRDSTTIIDDFAKEGGNTGDTATNKIGTIGTTYLDSPSSTSSLTYKVQMMSGQNNASVQCGASGAKSTMTLMEISV